MDSITLRAGDSWSLEVALDGLLFADILAPFNELGERHDEVMLTGSVAEVIESDWNKIESSEASQVWTSRVTRSLSSEERWTPSSEAGLPP